MNDNETEGRLLSPIELIEGVEALANALLNLAKNARAYQQANNSTKNESKEIFKLTRRLQQVLNIASRFPNREFTSHDIEVCLSLSRGGAFNLIKLLVENGFVVVLRKGTGRECALYKVIDQQKE